MFVLRKLKKAVFRQGLRRAMSSTEDQADSAPPATTVEIADDDSSLPGKGECVQVLRAKYSLFFISHANLTSLKSLRYPLLKYRIRTASSYRAISLV